MEKNKENIYNDNPTGELSLAGLDAFVKSKETATESSETFPKGPSLEGLNDFVKKTEEEAKAQQAKNDLDLMMAKGHAEMQQTMGRLQDGADRLAYAMSPQSRTIWEDKARSSITQHVGISPEVFEEQKYYNFVQQRRLNELEMRINQLDKDMYSSAGLTQFEPLGMRTYADGVLMYEDIASAADEMNILHGIPFRNASGIRANPRPGREYQFHGTHRRYNPDEDAEGITLTVNGKEYVRVPLTETRRERAEKRGVDIQEIITEDISLEAGQKANELAEKYLNGNDDITLNGNVYTKQEFATYIYSQLMGASHRQRIAVDTDYQDYLFYKMYGKTRQDIMRERVEEIKAEIRALQHQAGEDAYWSTKRMIKAENAAKAKSSAIFKRYRDARTEAKYAEEVAEKPFGDLLEQVKSWEKNDFSSSFAAAFDWSSALTLGFIDIAGGVNLNEALDKANRGAQLSGKEKALVKLAQLSQELATYREELYAPQSVSSMIGEGLGGSVAALPEFAIAMVGTGGIGAGVKYGTKAALKRYVANKTMSNAFKLGGQVALDLGKRSAVYYGRGMVAAPLMPSLYKSVLDEYNSQYSFGDDGKIIFTPKDKSKIWIGAYIDNVNEIASEHVGADFASVIGWGLKGTGRALRINKAANKTVTGSVTRKVLQAPKTEATKKLLKNLGYSGNLGGEILGEQYGAYMSQLQRMMAGADYSFEEVNSFDAWLTTIGVSAIMGASMTTIGGGVNIYQEAKMVKDIAQNRERMLGKIQDAGLRDHLRMLNDMDDPVLAASQLATFFQEHNIENASDKAYALDYVMLNSQLKVLMGDVQEQERMVKFEAKRAEIEGHAYTGVDGKASNRIITATDAEGNTYYVLRGDMANKEAMLQVQDANTGEVTTKVASVLTIGSPVSVDSQLINAYANMFSLPDEVKRVEEATATLSSIENPTMEHVEATAAQLNITLPKKGDVVTMVDGRTTEITEDLGDGTYIAQRKASISGESETITLPFDAIRSNDSLTARAQEEILKGTVEANAEVAAVDAAEAKANPAKVAPVAEAQAVAQEGEAMMETPQTTSTYKVGEVVVTPNGEQARVVEVNDDGTATIDYNMSESASMADAAIEVVPVDTLRRPDDASANTPIPPQAEIPTPAVPQPMVEATPTTEEVDAAQNVEQMPTNEDGTVDFDAIEDPAKCAKAMAAQLGGPENALAIVEESIEAVKAEREKVAKSKTPSLNEGVAKQQKLNELKARLIRYEAIAFELEQMMKPAEVKAEAKTEEVKHEAGLVENEHTADLPEAMRNSINDMAKRIGVRVVFVDERIKGDAEQKGNLIRVSTRNRTKAVEVLVGHEMLHYMKTQMPEAYKAFKKAVVDFMGEKEFGKAVAARKAMYAAQNVTLDDEAAAEEIVADFAGYLVQGRDVFYKFLEPKKNDNIFLRGLKKGLEYIRNIFGANGMTKNVSAVDNMVNHLNTLINATVEGKDIEKVEEPTAESTKNEEVTAEEAKGEEDKTNYALKGDVKYAMSEETTQIFDAAKAKYGTTLDMREAGYILPDGSMLDFSGRHQVEGDASFLNGDRTVDHREISDIAYDADGNETGINTDLGDFLDRGAIRIDSNAGAINLNIAPTKVQKDRLKRLIERNDGYVYIDFGKGWDTEHYAEYEGARASRVLGDIDRYFDEGIKPTGNVRFSLQETNDRFNAELDAFKAGQNVSELHLGIPSPLLRACGVSASEIFITAKTLRDHLKKHNLTEDEIKNLPIAINNPIMVYEWGDKAKSKIIITQIPRGEQRITVAIKMERGGKRLSVNELASVHGKDVERLMNEMLTTKSDFGKDNLKYVNKEIAMQWLGIAPPEGAASLTDAQQSIAKIIKDFPNPKISAKYSLQTPTFYSNAEFAVRNIKQDKATPEQWLKMIEKAGGLKAGEDKWLGLSDWLKASDKKTLTKDEVLQYIADNNFVIEEVEYADVADISREEIYESSEFEALRESLTEYDDEDNPYINRERYDELRSESYDFVDGFSLDYWGEELEINSPAAAATYLGLIKADKEIHGTRLKYTTAGLENKREIALVVPSIEPYNQNDEIHFGDAGEGRAVAWIRFGETEAPKNVPMHLRVDAFDAPFKNVAGYDVYAPEGRGGKFSKDYVIYGKLKDGSEAYIAYIGTKPISKHETLEEARNAMNEYYEANPRMTTRYERVLVIDEIQSKRHQDGREKGYSDKRVSQQELYDAQEAAFEAVMEQERALADKYGEDEWATLASAEEMAEYERLRALDEAATNAYENYDKGVPSAPFEKNWAELAMKRMLRYAAENGFDKVAWTTGEQQADRYNMSNYFYKIERFDIESMEGRRFELRGSQVIGINVNDEGKIISSSQEELEGKMLSDVVGKEMALKMMQMKNKTSLEDVELKVGGEGMKVFYDQMLPSFMNKYGKKWGVKVGEVTMPNLEENNTMHAVNVTDAMRESVMQGQPRFSLITPQMDVAYMDAVERGDMETAQRMVMEAAKLAMPNTKVVDEDGNPKVVYHGTPNIFTVFDKEKQGSSTDRGIWGNGFYFSESSEYAQTYAKRKGVEGQVLSLYLNLKNPLFISLKNGGNEGAMYFHQLNEKYFTDDIFEDAAKVDENMKEAQQQLSDNLIADGYDGVVIEYSHPTIAQEYVASNPNQIKSADPVTYDDNGNVIPLSERFNPEKEDIRYALIDPTTDRFNRIVGLTKQLAGDFNIPCPIFIADTEAEFTQMVKEYLGTTPKNTENTAGFYSEEDELIAINGGALVTRGDLREALLHEYAHHISLKHLTPKIADLAKEIGEGNIREAHDSLLGDAYTYESAEATINEFVSYLVEKLTIAKTYAIFAEEMSVNDYISELKEFISSDKDITHKDILIKVLPLVKENIELQKEQYGKERTSTIVIPRRAPQDLLSPSQEGRSHIYGNQEGGYRPIEARPRVYEAGSRGKGTNEEVTSYSLPSIPFYDEQGNVIDMNTISEAKALEMVDGRVRSMIEYDYNKSVVTIAKDAKEARRATRSYYAEERRKRRGQNNAPRTNAAKIDELFADTDINSLPLEVQVLIFIAEGRAKIRWADKDGKRGLASELGLANSASDKAAMKSIWTGAEQSFDEVVHGWWESINGYERGIDTQDLRNALIEAISAYPSAKAAMKELQLQYDAIATAEREALAEIDRREAADLAKAKNQYEDTSARFEMSESEERDAMREMAVEHYSSQPMSAADEALEELTDKLNKAERRAERLMLEQKGGYRELAEGVQKSKEIIIRTLENLRMFSGMEQIHIDEVAKLINMTRSARSKRQVEAVATKAKNLIQRIAIRKARENMRRLLDLKLSNVDVIQQILKESNTLPREEREALLKSLWKVSRNGWRATKAVHPDTKEIFKELNDLVKEYKKSVKDKERATIKEAITDRLVSLEAELHPDVEVDDKGNVIDNAGLPVDFNDNNKNIALLLFKSYLEVEAKNIAYSEANSKLRETDKDSEKFGEALSDMYATREDYLSALKMFNATLEDVIVNGKDKLRDFNIEKEKHEIAIRSMGIKAIGGEKAGSQGKKANAWQKAKAVVNISANAPYWTFETVLERIDRLSPYKKGEFYNYFMRKYTDANAKLYTTYSAHMERMGNAMANCFPNMQKFLGIVGRNPYEIYKAVMRKAEGTALGALNYKDKGVEREMTLTVANAMYIVAMWRQPRYREAMEANGITQEAINNLMQKINNAHSGYLQFMDWVNEALLPDTRLEYDEVYRKLNGGSMAKEENYFPARIVAHEEVKLDENGKGQLPTSPSALKERISHKQMPKMGMDYFKVLEAHIQDMDKWAAFAELTADLNILLSSDEFRRRLNEFMPGLGGDGGGKGSLYKMFYDTSLIATGNYHSYKENVFGPIQKAWATSNIAFRLWTAVKQISSVSVGVTEHVYLIKHMGMATTGVGIAYEWERAMALSPSLRYRWQSRAAGMEALMREVSKGDGYTTHRGGITKTYDVFADLGKAAVKLGMSPNALVDAIACSILVNSVYDKAIHNMTKGKREATEEERKEAIRKAEIAFNSTQQSSEGAYLSVAQANPLYAPLTTYMNASFALHRKRMSGVYEIGKLGEKYVVELWKGIFKSGYKMFLKENFNFKEDAISAKDAFADIIRGIVGDLAFAAMGGWGLMEVMAAIYEWLGGDGDDDDTEAEKQAFFETYWLPVFNGFLGGSQITSLFQGYDTSMTPAYDELLEDVGGIFDGKGDWRAEVAQVATKYGLGIDIKSLYRIGAGLENMVSEETGENAGSILMFLNAPNKYIKAFVGDRREGETLQQYQTRIMRLYTLFDDVMYEELYDENGKYIGEGAPSMIMSQTQAKALNKEYEAAYLKDIVTRYGGWDEYKAMMNTEKLYKDICYFIGVTPDAMPSKVKLRNTVYSTGQYVAPVHGLSREEHGKLISQEGYIYKAHYNRAQWIGDDNGYYDLIKEEYILKQELINKYNEYIK